MNDSYINAPATKLLATNCACCGRPLVDAISVSVGLGPECRKDFNAGITPEVQAEANKIIHAAAISAGSYRISEVLMAADKIEALGLSTLANKMRRRFQNVERKVDVTITEENGYLRVETPYRRGDSKAFIKAWQNVPGRRWVNGANLIPIQSKKVLWGLLKRFFAGKYAKGPKGFFKIPEEGPVPVQQDLKLDGVE
jgi:hypothetical protein